MTKLIINGNKTLRGEINISGNKNAVLPCLAASLMGNSPSIFSNVPQIEDVKVSIKLLEALGCNITWQNDHTLIVDPTKISTFELDPNLVAKLRASILYLGPLLAKFGSAKMRHPGGCIIGRRPVGTHFDALSQLGAEITVDETNYEANLNHEPVSEIFLDEVSVTATENALCLASSSPRTTRILGAACEPHVVNLAEYLSKMGAKIEGAGTNTITITGTKDLVGCEHEISPDYIETATFAILASSTNSQITINNCRQSDFHMIGVYLKHFGVNFKFVDSKTLVISPGQLKAPESIKEIQTRPWPGFPTDALSPLIVLATQASGSTLFHEWMYDGRLLFTDMLVTMGAKIITCDPHRVIVSGPTKLRGKNLASPDIRAGIALVIAGLIADGTTVIDNAHLIYRGYENITQRLIQLGADIKEE